MRFPPSRSALEQLDSTVHTVFALYKQTSLLNVIITEGETQLAAADLHNSALSGVRSQPPLPLGAALGYRHHAFSNMLNWQHFQIYVHLSTRHLILPGSYTLGTLNIRLKTEL